MIVDVHSHLLTAFLLPPDATPAQRMQANLDHFLRAQDESPVEFSVLSNPWLVEQGIQRQPPEAVLEATRRINDFTARLVARHPDRFVGLAAVYPQGGEPFLREFERAVRELDLRGTMVCPRHGDLWLDSPEDDEFLALACQLDVPIYLHPPRATLAHDHLADCRLDDTIGRGLETAIAVARMIMHGTFTRYPNLKLVASHGGGALPSLLGRLEYSWEIRDDPNIGLPPGALAEPPSVTARRVWVDTVLFFMPALRAVVDTYGADKVMLGSDTPPLPFPLTRCVADVEALDLPAPERAAILGDNAVALFRLPTRAGAR
ncbi:MAG TPA: amidohydrolase family protein [Chloroflexota bacterium]|jgi:aminocarboxymuconate-semialdehyde decarboxylase